MKWMLRYDKKKYKEIKRNKNKEKNMWEFFFTFKRMEDFGLDTNLTK